MAQSWIIVDKTTGLGISETWSQRTAKAINPARFEALPAADYLARLNRAIRAAGGAIPAKGIYS